MQGHAVAPIAAFYAAVGEADFEVVLLVLFFGKFSRHGEPTAPT